MYNKIQFFDVFSNKHNEITGDEFIADDESCR